MSAQPFAPPRLLTVAEYLGISQIEPGYSELLEGRWVISPSPLADHNWAGAEARDQLRPQLPPHLEIDIDIDIDPPVSLLACHLAGEFGYADGGTVTGKFTATTPFAVEIDLNALL
ncbi:MAG: hypothetical protein ACRDRH_10735 [Pseudonocardia sp.]